MSFDGRHVADVISRARLPEPPWFWRVSETAGNLGSLVRGDGAEVVLRDGDVTWPKRPGRIIANAIFPRGADPWDRERHRYVRCEASARRDRIAAELVRKGGLVERYLPLWSQAAKQDAENKRRAQRELEGLAALGAEPRTWSRDASGVVTLASGEHFVVTITNETARVRDLAVPVALLRKWLDVERDWIRQRDGAP